MQHKSTGPTSFQVCVCLCYGVAVHSTIAKMRSAFPYEALLSEFSSHQEFSEGCKWTLDSFSCTPELLQGAVA